MKAKMFKRQLWILFFLLALLGYAIANREFLVTEHLTNQFSLEKQIKETDERLSKLESEFHSMNSRMQAQATQAAAAKAQLDAIK